MIPLKPDLEEPERWAKMHGIESVCETWDLTKNTLKTTRQTLMMQPGPFLSAKENDDAFPPKHPPKKKNSDVSTSFTLLARYPTWSNWNSWQLTWSKPPASRPCFPLKRSDGEKRGSDGRSSSWVVIFWSRKRTPNFSLKICWEKKSLDQYVKHIWFLRNKNMLAFLPGFKQRFKQQAFKTPGFWTPGKPIQQFTSFTGNSANIPGRALQLEKIITWCHVIAVDGSEIWANSPVEGLIVYPIIYRVLYTSKRWLRLGFQPSTGTKDPLYSCNIPNTAKDVHQKHTKKLVIHPGKLTSNLKMNPWKRRFLLETIIFRFHVSFWGM